MLLSYVVIIFYLDADGDKFFPVSFLCIDICCDIEFISDKQQYDTQSRLFIDLVWSKPQHVGHDIAQIWNFLY